MLLFFCATTASAEEFNAGIVQGLWYSQEDIFAGDTVRIYVAIRNNTGSDLTGTIEFKDAEKPIDRKNVESLDGPITVVFIANTIAVGVVIYKERFFCKR